MQYLEIRNVGPIESVQIELKRFNVFIGAQSIGKSTIAKIFSTCSWLEKEAATNMDEKLVGTGDDFKTIYGDGVTRTDMPQAEDEVPEPAA